MTLHKFYRFAISCHYPNICPVCEKVIEHNDDFCDRCRNKMTMFYDDFHIEHSDAFVAYCYYEGKIRNAIRKYKITPIGNSYYAFAFGIVQALRRKQLTDGIDGVVYIPMTRDDFEDRGYNQVELMAKEIHFLLDIPVIDALEKHKATKSQKSLNGEERKTNVSGAFRVKTGIDLKGKKLLLIDDVCTTGSTLSEAARILKDEGASEVITAAFAKTMNRT